MEIAAVALQGITQAAAAPAVAPPAADALVTERFNAMMAAPPAALPGVELNATAAAVQGALAPAQTAPSLGGRILDGMREAGADLAGKWQDIAGRLDAMTAQPSIADMLRLQTDLLQASVQYELLSKGVTKSTQNVDSMVRMQ